MRLMAHNLDKTLLELTVALVEQTGGFGARQLRVTLDSSPLLGQGGTATGDLLPLSIHEVIFGDRYLNW